MSEPSRTVPASAASFPARILSSVVLPAPFGPTMPTLSPRARSRSSPRNSVRDPEPLRQPARLQHDVAAALRRAQPQLEASCAPGAAGRCVQLVELLAPALRLLGLLPCDVAADEVLGLLISFCWRP